MNQPMPNSGIRLIVICRSDERSRTKRVALRSTENAALIDR